MIGYVCTVAFWTILFIALLPFAFHVSDRTKNDLALTETETAEIREHFAPFKYFYDHEPIFVSVNVKNYNGSVEESYLDEVTYRVNKSVEQSGWGDAVLSVTGYSTYRMEAQQFGLIFTSSDSLMTVITVFVNKTYLPDITLKLTNYLKNEVDKYDTRNGKYVLYVTSSSGLLNGVYTESSKVTNQPLFLIISHIFFLKDMQRFDYHICTSHYTDNSARNKLDSICSCCCLLLVRKHWSVYCIHKVHHPRDSCKHSHCSTDHGDSYPCHIVGCTGGHPLLQPVPRKGPHHTKSVFEHIGVFVPSMRNMVGVLCCSVCGSSYLPP